jgi:hypothetical protein
MRITIDTREDSYEDALGVLRRAYGRHRPAPIAGESPVVPEAVDLVKGRSGAEGSGARSGSGGGRKDVGLSRRPTKGTKKTAAKRTSPARTPAVEAPIAKATGKGASARKSARGASANRHPGAPRKRASANGAANTAPSGESEAVRAWARDQGMQVRARGRMPAKVIAAYLEAHED